MSESGGDIISVRGGDFVGIRTVAALGITLKVLEQIDESKQIFDKGVTAFPTSVYCRMERWSNLAALAFRRDPNEALKYLRRILGEVGDQISLLDRIHTEVDVAMALFLAKRWDEAAIQATRGVNLADANGIPAQGARARNILGCISWCRGYLDDALIILDRAVLDAERSYMERFLWRFRVNLASVAIDAGQLSTALANARWAEDRLVRARGSRWVHLGSAGSHVTSRWYVALLAIGLIYYRCGAIDDAQRLLQEVAALPNFAQHLQLLLAAQFPAEIFDGTTHLHADRIMITG